MCKRTDLKSKQGRTCKGGESFGEGVSPAISGHGALSSVSVLGGVVNSYNDNVSVLNVPP